MIVFGRPVLFDRIENPSHNGAGTGPVVNWTRPRSIVRQLDY